MKPIELYQGEDKTIVVSMNDDLTSATEIEFIVDSPTQVIKKLSEAQISGVSSSQFSVQIDAADFATTAQGSYKIQSRATIAGKKYNIRHTPNRIKILNSVFENQGSGNDYGG